MLNQHDFGDPVAILRFQVHYREVNVEVLSRLIALARPLMQGAVIDEVVAWGVCWQNRLRRRLRVSGKGAERPHGSAAASGR